MSNSCRNSSIRTSSHPLLPLPVCLSLLHHPCAHNHQSHCKPHEHSTPPRNTSNSKATTRPATAPPRHRRVASSPSAKSIAVSAAHNTATGSNGNTAIVAAPLSRKQKALNAVYKNTTVKMKGKNTSGSDNSAAAAAGEAGWTQLWNHQLTLTDVRKRDLKAKVAYTEQLITKLEKKGRLHHPENPLLDVHEQQR